MDAVCGPTDQLYARAHGGRVCQGEVCTCLVPGTIELVAGGEVYASARNDREPQRHRRPKRPWVGPGLYHRADGLCGADRRYHLADDLACITVPVVCTFRIVCACTDWSLSYRWT